MNSFLYTELYEDILRYTYTWCKYFGDFIKLLTIIHRFTGYVDEH